MLKFNKSSTNLKFEKINHKLQQYLTNIQKICLATQTQISTRKKIIDSTSLIVSDLTLNKNKKIINTINSQSACNNDMQNLKKLAQAIKLFVSITPFMLKHHVQQ